VLQYVVLYYRSHIYWTHTRCMGSWKCIRVPKGTIIFGFRNWLSIQLTLTDRRGWADTQRWWILPKYHMNGCEVYTKLTNSELIIRITTQQCKHCIYSLCFPMFVRRCCECCCSQTSGSWRTCPGSRCPWWWTAPTRTPWTRAWTTSPTSASLSGSRQTSGSEGQFKYLYVDEAIRIEVPRVLKNRYLCDPLRNDSKLFKVFTLIPFTLTTYLITLWLG